MTTTVVSCPCIFVNIWKVEFISWRCYKYSNNAQIFRCDIFLRLMGELFCIWDVRCVNSFKEKKKVSEENWHEHTCFYIGYSQGNISVKI